jgi:hypothetical protein
MIDVALRAALEELSPAVEVEPGWPDVLRRAGRAAPVGPRRRALVLVASLVVAVPALATAGVLAFRQGQSLTMVARIEQAGMTASFSAHPSHSFRHTGSPQVVGFTRDLVWTLSLSGASKPVTARLVAAGTASIRLCGPCATETHGRVTTASRWWLKALGGRARLKLGIGGHVASARVMRPR